MTKLSREILRMASKGISQRSMASALSCSRHQVAKVLQKAEDLGLAWPLPENMSDSTLQELLFPAQSSQSSYTEPDYDYIDREMRKSGVTLTLLWTEYCESCRERGLKPFMYTQFCHRYRTHRLTSKATMHLDRQPGEQVEVDWAGSTATVINPDTGEAIPAFIFVASMSYSQYTYIEAFFKRDLAAWIQAHVHLFEFLGGVPKVVIPDNLRTGVSKADWYSPEIQRNYQELAEHYDTVILPARVRMPRDKPVVEGNVGHVTTSILAAIRKITCFTLAELNELLWEKLDTLNHRKFQKKDGSRATWFLEEKELLLPLPSAPFELSSWHESTVQFNYHIALDHMHYSVPYAYIKRKVQVKCTIGTVDIFERGKRIASHRRLYGRKGQYSTVAEHMPPDHQAYLEWDEARFLRWALTIGNATHTVIDGILQQQKIKQQAFKSCMGLLKLADKYSKSRLESACIQALDISPRPSYKTVKRLIQAQEQAKMPTADDQTEAENAHAFTRGADYYGGEQ